MGGVMAESQVADWNELKISSEGDAFDLIQKALSDQIGEQPCKLIFDKWPVLTIKLEGEGYDSTITPDLAEALVSLQHALDRSYARLVHDLANSRGLSNEEREALKFKAKVESGSSLIEINLGEWAERVGLALTEKMTPTQLVMMVATVAAIAGSTVAYKDFLDARSEDKKVEAGMKERVLLSQEETKRHALLVQALSGSPKLADAAQDFDQARVEILKGVGDADTLTVSGVTLNREEANTVARSKRSESKNIQANGQYKIIEVGWNHENEVRLKVADAKTGREFVASFKDDSLNHSQITLLQQAEWKRETVYLSINATELRGQITTAEVVGVGAPQ
jgi:hypothetical protein